MTTPKIELHVHLEGAVPPATLLEIARRNGQSLPADTVEGVRELYQFTDFAKFVQVWIMTTNCLRTADDFRQILVDYAGVAAGHGAVYLEAIFSPGERVQRGVPWEDLYEGYTDGIAEAHERHGVVVRLTPDLYRGMPVDVAEDVARWSVRYRERGIVGLGLGGDEKASSALPYAKAFEIAREGGLALVPHAGESAGAESVREMLGLDPDRLRHGFRAVDDSGVLQEIVDRGLVLDVCPTSNVRTKSVPSLAEHPLPALIAAGVPCTVNTDDPAMFNTDLAQEHGIAADLGLGAREAFQAGVAGAACDDATRAWLTERLSDIS
ncbi:adenosine deaminase [Dactylosporangium sp. AC04546]|uniref:adenosine deaminase n=1 Tax=Dactylosporangium sp. AC04546 TaxID=2862460 RepID=UPI001EE08893|nr:adenosine deaminase [Dactylosporangium sp. AC04546]WVK83923.1 adenosine deaminase [Dactylosporangium sp. AC04546]